MGRNYSNKNLTELELGNIEFNLNENKGFTEIGRILDILNLHHIPIFELNMKDMIIHN